MVDCNIIEVFHNISNTCSNDLLVARDECNLLCIISVMKGVEICSKELFNTGLLEQLKDLIKWCVYKKYETKSHI